MAAMVRPLGAIVTGGIGSIHRGSETTWDVYADLVELGGAPVAVISAGAKSILDLPKILEVLGTNGVGLPISSSANNIDALARLIRTELTFWPRYQMRSGLIVGVPIPIEQPADMKMTEVAIQQALTELAGAKVEGKNITPFLFSRVAALTNGRVNVAVRGVGGTIAVSLCKLGAKMQFIFVIGSHCRYIRTEMKSDGCSAQLILNVGEDRIGGYIYYDSHDDPKLFTASYIAVLDHTGYLVQAVADMDIY